LPPPPPVVTPPSPIPPPVTTNTVQSVPTPPPAPPPPVYIPPAPPAPPAVNKSAPAKPKGSPGRWVTDDTYPARAKREERAGTTGLRPQVRSDGRPTGCDVTSSSGNSDLDETACRLMMRRARFSPPLDSDGNPTTGTWSSRFTWKLNN